ncbi:hypothetical protein HaLaN_11112, partial [Haematococcus lacustris]
MNNVAGALQLLADPAVLLALTVLPRYTTVTARSHNLPVPVAAPVAEARHHRHHAPHHRGRSRARAITTRTWFARRTPTAGRANANAASSLTGPAVELPAAVKAACVQRPCCACPARQVDAAQPASSLSHCEHALWPSAYPLGLDGPGGQAAIGAGTAAEGAAAEMTAAAREA